MAKLSKINTCLTLNLLNKNIYNKSYLRGTKFNKQEIKQLIEIYDNNEAFYSVMEAKADEEFPVISKKVGSSINSRFFVFKHHEHNSFQFTRNITNFSIKTSTFFKNFLRLVYCLNAFRRKRRKFKIYCLLLQSAKGGFSALSYNFYGFVPIFQYCAISKEVLFQYPKKVKLVKNRIKFRILHFNLIKQFLTPVPVYNIIYLFLPAYTYAINFSSSLKSPTRFVMVLLLAKPSDIFLDSFFSSNINRKKQKLLKKKKR